jgi:RNA polymerase primary sigma factor
MDSTDTINNPFGDTDDARSPRIRKRNKLRSKRRFNHWAHRDPDEYVTYPRLPSLGYLEETRLIHIAQQGDQNARNLIWCHYARLAFSVANYFRIPDHLLPDAVQEGSLAIIKAIEKFEIEQYHSFSTYAWMWIYQNIQRFIIRSVFLVRPPDYLYPLYAQFRREIKNAVKPGQEADIWATWRSRNPKKFRLIIRFAVAAELRSISSLKSSECPAESWFFPDDSPPLRFLCERAMAVLNSRDRYIISCRYGFHDDRGVTLQELGQSFDLTRERIRQIQEDAHTQIRKELHKFRDLIPLAEEDEAFA